MDTPTPPPGYVLLKRGDMLRDGDMIYYPPEDGWPDTGWKPITGLRNHRVNDAFFCRPLPSEKQTDKEWLNPWD